MAGERFYCRVCAKQVLAKANLVYSDHPCPGLGTVPDYLRVIR